MSKHLSILIHFVWSTKNRLPVITPEIKPRLHAYLGGILAKVDAAGLCVNGVEDHVHVYASLPSTITIADAVSVLKSNSTRWVHETFPDTEAFAWQHGYGAFSVSLSEDERVRAYILGQEAHHRQRSFQDEYRAFLRRHNMEWDERYVWE
jgi:REP element-mobilizing transposase RayT